MRILDNFSLVGCSTLAGHSGWTEGDGSICYRNYWGVYPLSLQRILTNDILPTLTGCKRWFLGGWGIDDNCSFDSKAIFIM